MLKISTGTRKCKVDNYGLYFVFIEELVPSVNVNCRVRSFYYFDKIECNLNVFYLMNE